MPSLTGISYDDCIMRKWTEHVIRKCIINMYAMNIYIKYKCSTGNFSVRFNTMDTACKWWIRSDGNLICVWHT